ncbi:hypothetical protein [Hydrogenophaga sp. OTU3427]|uniref:hypothetical protein n=1 Tax=Hydrogenophaga sp. OTU3427 TaxID=3043856 RepID=UPI00313F0EF9
MSNKTYLTSGQSGIYRATIPIPHEQRTNLNTFVKASGARSLMDLIHVLLLCPEESGHALAPIFDRLAGEERKRQALEKLRADALRNGLTMQDLHLILQTPSQAEQETSENRFTKGISNNSVDLAAHPIDEEYEK